MIDPEMINQGMNLAAIGRKLRMLPLALALFAVPQLAMGQAPAALAPAPAASVAAAPAVPATADPAVTPAAPAAAAPAVAAPVNTGPGAAATGPKVAYSADHFTVATGGYTPMKPTAGKGMPVDGGIGFQDQYSPNGTYALWMHNTILMPVIIAISIFVLGLLMWVVFAYRSARNKVPSKTTHNTMLEVIWVAIPIFILVAIFVPSMKLLAKQYAALPANALTVKATGNQWYWSYSYPDNGGIEVTSNFLKEKEDAKPGERFRTDDDGPRQLASDNRMVVPVGEPIRLQTTGADVIHSFSVPSLWFKLDAVPGRINEKMLFIKVPGVYYGQCSELCGVRHGYMPIAVEALPRPQFNAWVMTHSGGKIDGAPATAPAPAANAAASAPSPAPAG